MIGLLIVVIAAGLCLELIELTMSSLRETRDDMRRNPM